MLKNILKTIVALVMIISVSNADQIDLYGNVKGVDVSLKSVNSLVVGENDFYVTLSKNGKEINNAKVRIKVFMPEMPGMPFMEYKTNGKYSDGKYKMMINFSMSGTWQYKLEWKTTDGVKYRTRGSLNL